MRTNRSKRRPARGEVPVRTIVVLGVLLALLIVPLQLWKKSRSERPAAVDAAERRASPTVVGGPPAPHVNDPERSGVTFGWYLPPDDVSRVVASCGNECKPAKGDTSCRAELPLLCLRPPSTEGGKPELGTADAVAGFVLQGRADGDARCAQSLGSGWRMAQYEDGAGGSIDAQRAPGASLDTRSRAWVAVHQGNSNCWDRP